MRLIIDYRLLIIEKEQKIAEKVAIMSAAGVSSRMKTQPARVLHIRQETVVSQEDIGKFGKK